MSNNIIDRDHYDHSSNYSDHPSNHYTDNHYTQKYVHSSLVFCVIVLPKRLKSFYGVHYFTTLKCRFHYLMFTLGLKMLIKYLYFYNLWIENINYICLLFRLRMQHKDHNWHQCRWSTFLPVFGRHLRHQRGSRPVCL